MEGQREKMVEEFMGNTGTDRNEAIEILNRNNWKLSDGYFEIEQMCRLSGQNQARKQEVIRQQDAARQQAVGSNSPSLCRTIDMGRGAAVNLNKGASPIGMYAGNTGQAIQSNQVNLNSPGRLKQGDISTLPQTQSNSQLSVKLPPPSSNSKQPKVIPIQIEGGGRSAALQQQQNMYKPSYVASSVESPRRNINQPASYNQSNYSASGGTNLQPRAVLDEVVVSSRPTMIAPTITRTQAVEEDEEDDVFDDKMTNRPPPVSSMPRLKRGFSNIIENESLVSEARHSVQIDIKKENHDNMYMHTFVLPDLTAYSEDFRAFLEKELVETSTLVSLEQAGRLNWWAELRLCQRLLPIATSGDGNCLLHAASLAMWGIHDRELILRKELYETLTKASYKDALYRRWRYQQTMINKESGLVFDDAEWAKEWENILHLASPRPRGAPDPSRSNNCCDGPLTQGGSNGESVVYESLEEFHVFVLAHVLQRPILVVSDVILNDARGEALAPIPFPGIYLPLECKHFHRAPLLLTYDAAHFSALCASKQEQGNKLPAAIPLVHPDRQLLSIHFFVDPGPKVDWSKGQVFEPSMEDKINMLQKFLDVDRIPMPYSDTNGDSDLGSCGSQDSDESSYRDKKDKKRDAKVSQQMHTVAKQFGSIGKSMGKKLKNLGKKDKTRKPSIGSEITQSTKIMNLHGNYGNGRDFVLVAHLSLKGSPQQEQLVDNYLDDAKERFKRDKELKRRNDIELRSRVSSLCNTPGCNAYGTASTNYLCDKCYNLQTSVTQRPGGQYVYNTFPGRIRQQSQPSTAIPSEEIFCYGKSKFYTSSNEDIDQQLPTPPVAQSRLSAPDRMTSRSSGNVNMNRHPSPDYDNYDRELPTGKPVVGSQGRVHEVGSKCRTSTCRFYGSRELGGLCGECYHRQTMSVSQSAHTKL